MDTFSPSRWALLRRALWSVGLLALSLRADLIAAAVDQLLPWLLCMCGVLGLASVLWLVWVGPVRVDYERVFLVHDRLSSAWLAQLFLRIALRGFWLLQALDLLVDDYPKGPPTGSDEHAPTAPHHTSGRLEHAERAVTQRPAPRASGSEARRPRGDANGVTE